MPLPHLEAIIQDRKAHPRPDSYTCQLLIAAQSEGDERLVSELADLTYHALVLLAARDLSWANVEAEVARRFG